MWPAGLLVLALAAFGNADPTKPPQYDTIIVGLGAAGVTAANTLCNAGRKVLALEAQNRIGGRVYTVPFGDGVVEVGAEWIHGSNHSRTYELAISKNITILNQEASKYTVFMSDGTEANKQLLEELMEFCMGVYFKPPSDTDEPLGQLITRKFLAYLQEKHPELLNDEDFITQFLHVMDVIINSYESSSSWNDVSVKSNYRQLGGSQSFSWHRYGYKTLFDILLNTYNNGTGLSNLDLKLNKEVVLITWPQDSGDVKVECRDGSIYTARNVIVTVSVGVLKERHSTLFSPPLPAEKITAIEAISFGLVMKIILKYDQIWWHDSSMFMWRGIDKKDIPDEDLWITDIEGATEMMGCGNCLSFWITGPHVKMVETLPEDLVKTKLVSVVKRFLGKEKNIPEPTDMIRTTWFANPFTRGTYSYDGLSSRDHPTARADLAAPLVDASGALRVLFAGEATDEIHFSTVHGATDTGFREANRIMTAERH